MTEESGEFECPRCGNRMVRYRITKLWVHAECGRAGCFQVTYRRKQIWLSHCQQQVLSAIRNQTPVNPFQVTVESLLKKGFLLRTTETPGYKLNQEKCDEYRVFDLTKKGGD